MAFPYLHSAPDENSQYWWARVAGAPRTASVFFINISQMQQCVFAVDNIAEAYCQHREKKLFSKEKRRQIIHYGGAGCEWAQCCQLFFCSALSIGMHMSHFCMKKLKQILCDLKVKLTLNLDVKYQRFKQQICRLIRLLNFVIFWLTWQFLPEILDISDWRLHGMV